MRFVSAAMIWFVYFCASSETALAQRWQAGLYHQRIETQTGEGKDTTVSNNQLSAWKYVSQRFGVWGFVYQETDYVSGVGGVFYDLTSWFELGVALGAERYGEESASPRFASTVLFFGDKPCSLEGYYEVGRVRHDYWYSADLLCKPVDGFGFGIYSQSGMGTGARFVARVFRNLPLEIWYSPFMIDNEGKNSNRALGIQLVLQDRE